MKIAELKDVRIQTTTKTLLKIDSLHIEQGGRYILFGPSGAGKSTLLKFIALLQPATTGEYLIFGERISDLSINRNLSIRRKMVYVSQHEVLYNKTVGENVAIGLKFRKNNTQEQMQKVDSMLKLVGLEGYEKRNVASLSGGEIQRVALARSLALEPDLLILDEPTANLDPSNVKLMEQAILQYCKVNGATLIMATHNITQAKRIGGVGLFLQEGRIEKIGELPSMIENPKDKCLVEFLEWA